MSEATEHPGHGPARQYVLVGWQRTDRHLPVTLLGVGVVLVAAALAIGGLPAVDLHSFLHRLGIMDPMCGGTRAAYYTATGQWATAWRYNPMGLAIVLGGAGAVVRAAVGLLTHRWITVTISWTPHRAALAITALMVLLVALEVRQQLRADLLIAGT